VLVTDHGIAVNPARPEIRERLLEAGLKVVDINALYERAISLTGVPKPIEFTDKIVGVIRYRDGSVIDTVRQVKEEYDFSDTRAGGCQPGRTAGGERAPRSAPG
jgi:citrate lyase subunit alpha/citrate CoA-transferase